MNLDKHDLLRNAGPGFIFLIVILSFYAVSGKLDDLKDVHSAILVLVAGFPLGLVIQSLYRIVFHVWFGEQAASDRDEAALVDDTVYKGSTREKAHYVWFQLYASKFSEWRGRLQFLYSYAHSLGASVLAIGMALVFMFTVKYPLWLMICPDSSITVPGEVVVTSFLWSVVAIVLYLGRRRVLRDCRITTEIFWNLRNT